MPEIPVSEYIESLLIAYQNAEKIYNLAVSDVIAAERRRDEAEKCKEDARTRLELARQKYTTPSGETPSPENPVTTSSRPPRGVTRKTSQNNGKKKQVRRQPIKKAIAESESTRTSPVENIQNIPMNVEEKIEISPVAKRLSITSPQIILSPTAGHSKAPKIFLTNPESPRRRSSNRIVPLLSIEDTKPIFEIAKGRSREWYDKNFDCEASGLVKKFYQAAFGTKTNEKTQKVTVRTIVLNDEWNDLVKDTSEMQLMYIGKSAEQDSKPTLRDRAADALVNPPQQDPVALFFAPKNLLNTNEIYYGGHWKVVDGKMLHPPRAVKGQLRQCLAKFVFVGVDRQIVEAINKEL